MWRGHYNHSFLPPFTCPTLHVSPAIVLNEINVCSHMFSEALFVPVHTCMYLCCTSTYSHWSLSHFISLAIQAPSRLRPSRVSFLRLSNDLLAESSLSTVWRNYQYCILHKRHIHSFKNRVHTSTYSVHICMTEYVLVYTDDIHHINASSNLGVEGM